MTSITEKSTEALAGLGKPFKYLGELALVWLRAAAPSPAIRAVEVQPCAYCFALRSRHAVTCMIMQDTGAGVCSTPVASFDGVSDGLVAISWPTEKAKETATMYCIVTVCGMAIFSR